MEEKKKPSDIILEQGKEPPEFGKNSDAKAKKKKQGTNKGSYCVRWPVESARYAALLLEQSEVNQSLVN